MAYVVHHLDVLEFAGDNGPEQALQAVREVQDCGEIKGGGTCPSPLRIELSPVYAAAPEMLAALNGLFEHCAMIHKHWGGNCNSREADAAIKQARAAIAKATT